MTDYDARTVHIAVAGLAVLFVLLMASAAVTWWRGTGIALRNDSEVVLRNVQLVGSYEDREFGRFDEVRPGETVSVDHEHYAAFRLRVEFDAPDGHRRFDDVLFIDPDERGDHDVRVGPDLTFGGTRDPDDGVLVAARLGWGGRVAVPSGAEEIVRVHRRGMLRVRGPAELRILEITDEGNRVLLEAGEISEARAGGVALEIQTPAEEVSLVLQNATGSARVTDSEIILRRVEGDLVQVWADGELRDLEDEWRQAR